MSRIMRERRSGRLVVVVALLWGIFSVSSSVEAQRNDVGVRIDEINVTWSILLRPSVGQSWVPLQVVLVNTSNRPRDLEIRLKTAKSELQSEYSSWSVQLDAGATRSRILPAYVGGAEIIRVYLQIFESGRPLHRDLIEATAQSGRRALGTTVVRKLSGVDPDVLVGNRPQMPQQTVNAMLVCKDVNVANRMAGDYRNAVAASAGFGTRRDPRSVETSVVNLPESLPEAIEAYEAVDRVFLCGIEPEDLSLLQARTLKRFVQSGRVVWLIPDSKGRGYGWVIPPDQIKVELRQSARGEIRVWAAANEVGVSDPAEPDEVLIYADGLGEWRRIASVGRFPYPFVADLVWDWYCELMSPADDRGGDRAGFVSWHETVDDIIRKRPNPLFVFTLIVIYLIVVGPLLFWVTRRRGRPLSVLWWQPLIVVLFLGLILGVGYLQFGTSARSYETVVLFQPGGSDWAYGQTLHTLYNPRQRSLDLDARGGELLFPLNLSSVSTRPAWHLGDSGWTLLNYSIGEWSYAHFLSSRPVDLGGSIRAERIRKRLPNSDVEVPGLRVNNDSAFQIERVFDRIDDRLWEFEGMIAPGEQAEFYVDDDRRARTVFDRDPSVPRSLLSQLARADFIAELNSEDWRRRVDPELAIVESESITRSAFVVAVIEP